MAKKKPDPQPTPAMQPLPPKTGDHYSCEICGMTCTITGDSEADDGAGFICCGNVLKNDAV
jgi:hypothetical protein